MSRGNQPQPYRIVVTRVAERALENLAKNKSQRKALERLLAKIAALAGNPRPQGVEKLTGPKDRYRVRSGDYRVIDGIDDENRVVDVKAVGDRKDVYRE
jgi:mRNA interferase RelE/StbE